MMEIDCTWNTKRTKFAIQGRAAAYFQSRVAVFHPAYFALVMATGIVSIGCHLLGLKEFAVLLFAINILAYLILWILYFVRAFFFWDEFVKDWFSHKRAFGFFTLVAGTNVVGSQCAVVCGNLALASSLWVFGLILWFICTYGVFVFLIIGKEKPSIEVGINGGWLVAVVATQSICVLGSQLASGSIFLCDVFALSLLSFWMFGGMLYIWLISLIVYRYLFFKFEPSDLIPPYWINMGAMAITTLAGAELIRVFAEVNPICEMLPFVKGLTTMYWATATWWIPMLLVLGVWRHFIRRFKFQYDPLYWGLVFPLGMYSVCSLKLGVILKVGVMHWIAQGFLIVGLLAWLITFLSMLQRPLYLVVLALRQRSTAVLSAED
ncbi:MAG: tellurite resistance/C4-dicarboxylate transporter family protein [Cyanobacteriota/Melainabacteria group bacterium]